MYTCMQAVVVVKVMRDTPGGGAAVLRATRWVLTQRKTTTCTHTNPFIALWRYMTLSCVGERGCPTH